MKKTKIKLVEGGIRVEVTPEYQDKKEREKRMKDRKEKPNKNPSNKDLYDLMMDFTDRQSEIYDLLKNR